MIDAKYEALRRRYYAALMRLVAVPVFFVLLLIVAAVSGLFTDKPAETLRSVMELRRWQGEGIEGIDG